MPVPHWLAPVATALVALAALLPAGPLAAQATPPATDLYVVPLSGQGASLRVGAAEPVTRRRGYDNQPAFNATGDGLYYTSQRGSQTEIVQLNLGNGASRLLRPTPESEYSATLMPDRAAVSVIRVEADSAQRLWRLPLDGSDPTVLLPDVKPVGYHAWTDDSTVVLFVLGQPATLQVANVRTGRTTVVERGIGRWLATVPGRGAVGFVRLASGGDGIVMTFTPGTGRIDEVAPAISGTQDYAWLPDGTLLGASGSVLRRWDAGQRSWVEVADLSSQGIRGITRLVTNRDGTRLALVALER
jgi:hypothetical protein